DIRRQHTDGFEQESPPPEPTPTPPPQPPPPPARQASNISIPNGDHTQAASYSVTGTPAMQAQPPRTSTPSHPPLQQRQSFTPAHPTQYHHTSASPAPFQAQSNQGSQQGAFQPPPLTPHGSFHNGPAGAAANTPTTQFANYTTPQTYQPRPVQPSYQTLQQQPPHQHGGPVGAGASLAPTPIGGPGAGSRGYNAPQPPEVYCLSDAANASIPEDIRKQFHCDDQGRVLFFTAPPVEVGGPSSMSLSTGDERKADDRRAPREELKLGHSVRYLAARARRDALVAEKRKRDADDEAVRAPEAKRARLQSEADLRQKLAATMDKAVGVLEDQLAVATKVAMVDLAADGTSSSKEVRRDLELLGARWRVAAERGKTGLARADRAGRNVQLVE
ncbi:MAG: hypothetical protein INR71_10940, partial [Terriglobus roseus]|nr:hypothetical protein [Terriglobus roseus]